MKDLAKRLEVVAPSMQFSVTEDLFATLRAAMVAELEAKNLSGDHLKQVLLQVQREMLIREYSEPLTEDDLILVGESLEYAGEKCKEGRHHTAGKARGAKRTYRSAGLITARRREHSTCCETGFLTQADAESDTLLTIAIAHFKPGKNGGPKIVECPCGGCAERLRSFAPHAWFILDHKGKLLKVPGNCFLLFSYPDGYEGRD